MKKVNFEQALEYLQKEKQVTLPTLGNRSEVTFQFSDEGIEIINSKGNKFEVDKEFWNNVEDRIFDLDSNLRFSTSYYTLPEWDEGNPNFIFSPYLVPFYKYLSSIKEIKHDWREAFENKYHFVKVGEYFKNSNDNITRELKEGIAITERLNLVYAFFNDSECLYIGKTIQGYKRPFGYHKNTVMKTVNFGISDLLDKGGKVEVLVRNESVTMEMDGMQLNLIEAIEQALISKCNPIWNNFIQK